MFLVGVLGCADGLPSDVAGYAERCTRLNATPIPSKGEDDPHEGTKNVYACNVDPGALRDAAGRPVLPYPEGTLLVKESVQDGQGFVWVLALMRKQGGRWEWAEYQRNFADQDFGRLAVPESLCMDCHAQVEAADWVFTPFDAPGVSSASASR